MKYKYITMDSEYCGMGRWISVIVANQLGMKLYEIQDLLKLVNINWTKEDLFDFDNYLLENNIKQLVNDQRFKEIDNYLKEAITIAINKGPAIFHERYLSRFLNKDETLSIFIQNSNQSLRRILAKKDKTYNNQTLNDDKLDAFICREDLKRQTYRDIIEPSTWGNRKSYDLLIDAGWMSKEKAAEIIIEAMKPIQLDKEACKKIIQESFKWSQE